MSVTEFKKYSEKDLDAIVFELKNIKAAIVETDTIIGIICPDVDLIYKIKERSLNKKIVSFIHNKNLIPDLTYQQREFLDKFWPGGVTVIKNGISYRSPDDPFILKLLKQFNVLYCSSANISNQEVIKTVDEANEKFNVEKYYYELFLIEHTNCVKSNIESSIVDIDNWKIIRSGFKADKIEEYINNLNTKNA